MVHKNKSVIANHLESTDAAGFTMVDIIRVRAWGNHTQYTLDFIKYIELNELMPNSND